MGGLDRIATIVKSIRAERDGRTLLLDGGDTWTNSWTSLKTNGQDMVDVMALLRPDAMTGHWEFTLGEARVKELVDKLGFPFLAQNIRDSEFEDPVFPAHEMFERGGVKVAVIGQAFPFTPIANPRWMIPKWTFGIRDGDLQEGGGRCPRGRRELVVLLSHNGFDVDRKVARSVKGIDVLLSGHTHDAVPEPIKVDKTLIVAIRLQRQVRIAPRSRCARRKAKSFRYRLIPVFADAIEPTPRRPRWSPAPCALCRGLSRVLGRTQTLLYRRGNFNGTLDDVICDAIATAARRRDRALAGCPLGHEVLPGQDITLRGRLQRHGDDLSCYLSDDHDGRAAQGDPRGRSRQPLQPRSLLPAGRRHGAPGRPVLHLDIDKPMGDRISDLRLQRTGAPLESGKDYVVAGWAS